MNPDDYRVAGPGGARYYQDRLPGCDLAPECEDTWPSVTTIKSAWSKPYRKRIETVNQDTGEVESVTVPLDAFWVAEYAVQNVGKWDMTKVPYDEAVRRCATAAGRTLNRAATRGTAIHGVLEAMSKGEEVDRTLLGDDAYPFFDACAAFVDDCRPTWLANEVVIVNRGVGFGGTLDAVLTIDNTRYLVDWKTRTAHGAYAEDAAQLGGYNLAEYWITDEGRTRPLQVDGGLVVSITAEDGYQLFPVELGQAGAAFLEMYECWARHKRGTSAARSAIGKPLTNLPDRSDLQLELTTRIIRFRDEYPEAMNELAKRWPEGVPTLKVGGHSMGQLRTIQRVVTDVEDYHQLPF